MNDFSAASPGRGPFAELQGALNDLLDQVKGLALGLGPEAGFPRAEVRVEDDAYLVLVEVPGMVRDDIEVTVTGRTLTVSGDRRKPDYPEGEEPIRSERRFGRFERRIELPGDIDAKAVVAELRQGVLSVRAPKHAGSRGRRIKIETGGASRDDAEEPVKNTETGE